PGDVAHHQAKPLLGLLLQRRRHSAGRARFHEPRGVRGDDGLVRRRRARQRAATPEMESRVASSKLKAQSSKEAPMGCILELLGWSAAGPVGALRTGERPRSARTVSGWAERS